MKRIRIAYLVSHPIQYQAPLLRRLAHRPELDLNVFFHHSDTAAEHYEPGFGRAVSWDVSMTDGYKHATTKHVPMDSFQLLWVHGYSHPTNVRAIREAASRKIPVLFRGESTLRTGSANPIVRTVKMGFLKWFLPRCSGFMCIGSMNREYYLHHRVSESRLFNMPYAVDNAFFAEKCAAARPFRENFRKSLGLEKGRPVILFAGKLLRHKGPMDLLNAYSRLSVDSSQEPHPYLIFAGSGPEQQALQRKARETGWNSIRFLGFQNQTELPRIFDLCDLFVLPSLKEPWGLIVNEVMNAGKPVVVSDAAGCGPDLVTDGYNGWTYRAGDASALSKALRKAFDDPRALPVMGQNSFRRIQDWSFDQDVDGLLTAADRVLAARN